MYRLPDFEPVHFSVSGSNCCFLTFIQVSQDAGKGVRYPHLFKNFPQFFVIHLFKGSSIVNEAEVDVFLKFSCFFYDPTDVDNLISSSSAFSKSSLNIWKFLVHLLLKSCLENFEHYFASMCCCCWVASVVSNSVRPYRRQPTRLPRPWDSPGKNTGVGCHFLLQCMKSEKWNVKVKSLSRVRLLASNCAVVWTFFGIVFLWDWNESWPFSVLWPVLNFPNMLAYWVQHFHSIIF